MFHSRGEIRENHRQNECDEQNREWMSAERARNAIGCVPAEIQNGSEIQDDRGRKPERPLQVDPQRNESGEHERVTPPARKYCCRPCCVRGKKREKMREEYSENSNCKEQRIVHC